MGRSQRVDVPNGWYHVMNRGVNRQPVFFGDADRIEFGRLLGLVFQRFGVEVAAYCLLDNHYHLVLHCPDGGLSEAMHLLGSVFTRHANDRASRDGPLFRGRFHSIPIVDDRQLLVTVRYVHRNALDLPGVLDVAEYRWSSHRAYLGCRRSPEFLCDERVLDVFGGDGSAFGDFVSADLTGAIVVPPSESLQPLLEMVIDEVFGLDRPGPKFARTVQMLMLPMIGHADRRTLTESLGFANVAARDRALRRARQRAAEDQRVGRVVLRALELLRGQSVPGTD